MHTNIAANLRVNEIPPHVKGVWIAGLTAFLGWAAAAIGIVYSVWLLLHGLWEMLPEFASGIVPDFAPGFAQSLDFSTGALFSFTRVWKLLTEIISVLKLSSFTFLITASLLLGALIMYFVTLGFLRNHHAGRVLIPLCFCMCSAACYTISIAVGGVTAAIELPRSFFSAGQMLNLATIIGHILWGICMAVYISRIVKSKRAT